MDEFRGSYRIPGSLFRVTVREWALLLSGQESVFWFLSLSIGMCGHRNKTELGDECLKTVAGTVVCLQAAPVCDYTVALLVDLLYSR